MSRSTRLSPSEQVSFIQETESLLFHRWRMHWQKSQSGRRSDPVGKLTDAQLHTVMVVRYEGRIAISRLADIQGVSRPSMSAMVERLVAKGALTRQTSPDDRRKVIVRVSPRFEKHLDEAEASRREFHRALARKLGPAGTRSWYTALKRVRQVFEAQDNHDGAETQSP